MGCLSGCSGHVVQGEEGEDWGRDQEAEQQSWPVWGRGPGMS